MNAIELIPAIALIIVLLLVAEFGRSVNELFGHSKFIIAHLSQVKQLAIAVVNILNRLYPQYTTADGYTQIIG